MSVEFYIPGNGRLIRSRDRLVNLAPLAQAGRLAARIAFGRSFVGRAARIAAVCLALGGFAFSAGQASVTASATPRGLMYDVGGGRRMRLVCEGAADASKPTVIFESGAFGFSGDWANVQHHLTTAGVHSCAYDRAGMGLSDPSPEQRDGVHVARDLEKLLAAAKVQGPLVLVGHSMAGARLHLFANRNPSRIAGLVFVDTTPSEAMDDPMVRQYVAGFTEGAHAAARTAPFGILKLLSLTALGDKVGLPPEEDLEKRWQFGSASYERTAYLETRDWPLVAVQALRTGPINPKWPVAVVSAGVTEGVEGPRMKSVQPAPALASDHGYISVVDGATHNGLLTAQYSPAIVQGIDFVLNAASEGPAARRETVMRTETLASLNSQPSVSR